MKNTNTTPGMFHFYGGGLQAKSIVLDHVASSVMDNGTLYAYLATGISIGIPEKVDQEAFGLALREHVAMKNTYISTTEFAPQFSTTAIGDACTACTPGAHGESLGEHMVAKANSLEDLLGLLDAMRKGKQIVAEPLKASHPSVHHIDLTGVDITDTKAMLAATEAVSKALREHEAAPASDEQILPTRFMQMLVLGDYCAPIRDAVRYGFEQAALGTKWPAIAIEKETVRDMLRDLGRSQYLAEKAAQHPPLMGDLGSTYMPVNKAVLMGHLQYWNDAILAGRLPAFAPGDRVHVVKQGDGVWDRNTVKVLQEGLVAKDTEIAQLKSEVVKYQRVVRGVQDAQEMLAGVVSPREPVPLKFKQGKAPGQPDDTF